jgi:predicted nucleic-acid-binding protein
VVIVADTNVWARAFLGDDPQQSPKARKALAAARTKEGVFIPLVVMAELSWVLRGAKWERDRILRTLDSLLQTRGVTLEAPQLVRLAIDATRMGGRGGVADHLIAEVGFANGCREALTFDALFGKAERVRRLQ